MAIAAQRGLTRFMAKKYHHAHTFSSHLQKFEKGANYSRKLLSFFLRMQKTGNREMWENPFSGGGGCGVYGRVVKIAVALKAFLKTLSLCLLHSATFSHFCPNRSFAPKNVGSLACACKNGHNFDALAGQEKCTFLLFLEKYGNPTCAPTTLLLQF